jgi:ABC-type dipeptide/oligopeptide/nickel transport system permease component
MWVWLLKRIGQVVPTLFILSILIFGLQQLMPGDPALILAGEERGDPQVLAQCTDGRFRLFLAHSHARQPIDSG